MATELSAAHRRRLREIWRSAGWPCQDMLEVELLHAGLLQRLRDAEGRETLRVTDAGIALLAQTLQTQPRGARCARGGWWSGWRARCSAPDASSGAA